MRIRYDHQIFCAQQYGGISRYFSELSSNIASFGLDEVEILAPVHVNRYQQSTGVRLIGWRVPQIPRGRALLSMANNVVAATQKLSAVNIYHETFFQRPNLAPLKARRVLTVYDMIEELLVDRVVKHDSPKMAAIKRADHIIAISESTRRDLLEMSGVAPEKVSVVYLGNSIPRHVRAAQQKGHKPYFLYVGRRDGYKNFSRVLRAMSMSAHLSSNFVVRCFGGGALTEEEKLAAGAAGVTVLHVAGDDHLLADLYANAEALVYPSLYEGFGLPPLEAMSLGCPVACSNTSSLPEVVGNAAVLFDPNKPDELVAALERIAGSPDTRRDLIKRGHEQSAQFSWRRCAGETRAIYCGLIKGHRP